jgi:acetyl-CoA carboxylase carboxyl transferase subunit alpha
MSNLRVPIVAVITGEGGSGGALALAVADKVYMFENAIYSVLSPEGFATILWKDGSRAMEAAELMKITASELEELGVVDGVLPDQDMDHLKAHLIQELNDLTAMEVEEMLEMRYNRFRKY